MTKQILIIGGRDRAASLSQSLVKKGYKVTVINMSEKDCERLAAYENIDVFLGDGTKPYVLEDVNAHKMDMAISLLPKDEDNLVACELCKKKFHIEKTVSLLGDSKKIEFFHKMGVDKVVCSTEVVTEFIEQQAFLDKISKSIPIAEGVVEIMEISIDGKDPAVGREVVELDLPNDVIIGCILRDRLTLVPSGETVITPGDLLILIMNANKKYETMTALKGDGSRWQE